MAANILFRFQKLLLVLTYFFSKPFSSKHQKSWIVGVDDIASMVYSIGNAIPNSFTVSFRTPVFYSTSKYSFSFPRWMGPKVQTMLGSFVGPILLGYLSSRSIGFIYLGSAGFLLKASDYRKFEFEWLKSKGKKIVCYFTGTDIRSPKLMLRFEEQTGLKTLGGRISEINPNVLTPEYEIQKQEIAKVADGYANLIFNARIDQMSYLKSNTLPFSYFYPDNQFQFLPDKFNDDVPLRVLHSPSSPYLKGTEYVRQAVNDLISEGYEFEYVELIDANHSLVITELGKSQIVLNEFFSFVPGVFGVEAMAHTCALITSADEQIETDLPPGSNNAWVRSTHLEIKNNLRKLLDDREFAKMIAISGYQWSQKWASESSSGRALIEALSKI